MADFSVVGDVLRICQNKKNVNEISDMLTKLNGENDGEVNPVISILHGVFVFYLKQGVWQNIDSVELKEQNNADFKVNSWLKESYVAFIDSLLRLINHENTYLREECLEKLLKLLKVEQEALKNPESDFPFSLYEKILLQLLSRNDEDKTFIDNLFLDCIDMQFFSLKVIKSVFKNKSLPKNTLQSIYLLLMKITTEKDQETKTYITSEAPKKFNSVFSSTWLLYMQANLPVDLHKQVLVDLDTKIMPHLNDPKVLIDFLVDSYNAGGVTSLLALNGLFILITQHNLDYPDFYKKLYNLLDPTIFQTKYKSRFFYLLDLFLGSTHLTSNLVIAFTKRLSRMLLYTPVTDTNMVLVFIKNLLIRHPSAMILINRKYMSSIESDVYNLSEVDPEESNAHDSCLWELNTLKQHFSSDVFKTVTDFRKDFPIEESDISDHFDVSYEDMFQAKISMSAKGGEVPVNFIKDSGIIIDDNMWCFK